MDILKSVLVWITAVCFLGILFPLTFAIWIVVYPFDRERVVTHWILVYQSVIMSWLVPIWKIRIDGREKVNGLSTFVLISNHQSMLDILLVNCLRYRFKWISKVENMRVPVLGWYLRMAGYITVNRGNDESKAEMLDKSLACLKRGVSIMLFPEGTRSLNGGIGFYKRGAFQLAIQAGVPLLPVVLDGTSDILPKHGLKFRSGYKVTLRVMDPVYPSDFGTDNPDLLAGRLNTLMSTELASIRSKPEMK
jgi:1-acyl-sn-glycerol-3-phosphate acyltransferase